MSSDSPQPSKWRRRLKRGLVGMAIALPVLGIVLWIAVHTFPGLGPMIADGLRAVLGTDNVARLEDFVYGVEDDFNQWWRKDEKPKSYWDVPSGTAEPEAPPAPTPSTSASADARPVLPPFTPANVGPLHKALAAKGDGIWVSVVDPARPHDPVAIKKTLIHPDAKRPWAELFVIAVDLRVLELHAIAGSAEPKATTAEGRAYQRTGVIPAKHWKPLVIAFNGGFKMTHGRWGMHIDGVTLLPPRRHGCALIKHATGRLQIHPYMGKEHDSLLAGAIWWRQTPPCMFHNAKRHGGLWDPDSKNWGAALGGDTVIRRSAIGLDERRNTLFMGVSNHTAAQVIANGMHHAGAHDVAQLDVNWSFPKIVIFERDPVGTPKGKPLFDGFKVAEGEYVLEPSRRDFFYMTRKASPEK